jgi:hypothetical protein
MKVTREHEMTQEVMRGMWDRAQGHGMMMGEDGETGRGGGGGRKKKRGGRKRDKKITTLRKNIIGNIYGADV